MGFLIQNRLSPGFVGHFEDAKRMASCYKFSNFCHFISTSTLELDMSPTADMKPCQEKLPLPF